jgi:hypothetical protein
MNKFQLDNPFPQSFIGRLKHKCKKRWENNKKRLKRKNVTKIKKTLKTLNKKS